MNNEMHGEMGTAHAQKLYKYLTGFGVIRLVLSESDDFPQILNHLRIINIQITKRKTKRDTPQKYCKSVKYCVLEYLSLKQSQFLLPCHYDLWHIVAVRKLQTLCIKNEPFTSTSIQGDDSLLSRVFNND